MFNSNHAQINTGNTGKINTEKIALFDMKIFFYLQFLFLHALGSTNRYTD